MYRAYLSNTVAKYEKWGTRSMKKYRYKGLGGLNKFSVIEYYRLFITPINMTKELKHDWLL